MIKANELRIGNLVLDNNIERTIRGIKLDELGDVLLLDDKSTNRLCKNIEPIPLTPEILEKCGFIILEETIGGGHRIYKSPIGHNVIYKHPDQDGTFIYGVTDYGQSYYHLCGVKYLNQLQNLYFALTGEELEINL